MDLSESVRRIGVEPLQHGPGIVLKRRIEDGVRCILSINSPTKPAQSRRLAQCVVRQGLSQNQGQELVLANQLQVELRRQPGKPLCTGFELRPTGRITNFRQVLLQGLGLTRQMMHHRSHPVPMAIHGGGVQGAAQWRQVLKEGEIMALVSDIAQLDLLRCRSTQPPLELTQRLLGRASLGFRHHVCSYDAPCIGVGDPGQEASGFVQVQVHGA